MSRLWHIKAATALLTLSLVANGVLGYQRMQSSETAAGATPADQAGVIEYDKWLKASGTVPIAQSDHAGLTDQESRDLSVHRINENFREAAGSLMQITDPWLTLDEIYSEGTSRFDQLTDAEQQRRNALEEVTGKPWAEVDLEHSWSRRTHFYMACALNTGLKKKQVQKLTSIVAAGFRDAAFAKAHPLGLTTDQNIEAVNEQVERREREMRALLTAEQFVTYFKPLIANNVYDVWGPKERFGRDLTEDEDSRLLEILMPEHPLFTHCSPHR
jgi:hypothetical protein